MKPYQKEYLDNLRQFAVLSQRERPGGLTFEEYAAHLEENRNQIFRLGRRNMKLLREHLFPMLDNLYDASREDVEELSEFSFQLFDGRKELDVGLFCQIQQALLTLSRQKQSLSGAIRSLYWLGMGRNSLVSKLVGLELKDIEKFTIRMRLCFTEAAAYLKYYDIIDDMEIRGYILRSRANMALGQFHSPGEKIALLKDTLKILQDRRYQELAPSLPWERFIYLTHQNMTSCISHSRDKVMTPEDMADIMESAYIVYQRRFDEAEMQGKQPPAKSAFAYYTIEYYCGLCDLSALLTKIERLLDGADPTDYTPDGMYEMISLPAFYCQYLSQYPERIPPRKEYLDGLYSRMLDYVDGCPGVLGDGNLFLYLRQLSFTFIETGEGVLYGQFLQRLLLRFVPDVYRHSLTVGEGAKTLCAVLLDDNPGFFDDIPFIRDIGGPEEKRQAVLAYAMGCGSFHDVGKLSVIELHSRTPRQWFEEEYEMAHLHTLAGRILLEPHPSTSRYAPAALGHHKWYDGSRGYPDAYTRLECPARQMVDVVGLVDWLESKTSFSSMSGTGFPFAQAVEEAVKLEGRRFSPLLTALLRDKSVAGQLERAFERGRQNAYRLMYDDARRAVPASE